MLQHSVFRLCSKRVYLMQQTIHKRALKSGAFQSKIGLVLNKYVLNRNCGRHTDNNVSRSVIIQSVDEHLSVK